MPKRMYHGSPNPNLKTLKPSFGGQSKPTGVYATPRRGLATFFSLDDVGWSNIERVGDKWCVKNISDEKLAESGYLYHLDPDKFEHFQGWQYISEEPIKPLKREKIGNVGKELKKLGFKRKLGAQIVEI